MIMGPAVGALSSLALSLGQRRLMRDGISERQRLVDALMAAKPNRNSACELASAQRESGALAERTDSAATSRRLAQSFSSILLTARYGAREATPRPRGALRRVETSPGGLDESRRVVSALAP